MGVRHFMALVCVGAVAVAAVTACDVGDRVAGDINGDHRVDVLDLQIIVAQVLHSPNAAITSGLSGSGHVSVLDFQRALAQAKRSGHLDGLPPTKPVCKVYFSRYQDGWVVEPVEQKEESVCVAVALSHAARFDRPSRSISPPTTERYLFRLTSNAPPVSA